MGKSLEPLLPVSSSTIATRKLGDIRVGMSLQRDDGRQLGQQHASNLSYPRRLRCRIGKHLGVLGKAHRVGGDGEAEQDVQKF